MSETQLRRAAQACVDTLVRRGRPALAERVSAQVERLLRGGNTGEALALISLFETPSLR